MVKGLAAVELHKDYSGVHVLRGVSVSIKPGEIVGLVGHNGAGKSTLLKVFSGAHKHSGGKLIIDGDETHFSSPSDAISQGVSTVYQELSLLPNLTVTQNVWLGRELKGPSGLKLKEMEAETKEIVDRFGLNLNIGEKVGKFPMATRQLLEIAIAASRQTKYLLLDEPTTSLEGEQIDHLLSYVHTLAKEHRIGVLIVNHKLDELYQIVDRVVALADGKVVVDADAATVDRRQVVQAIAGEEAAAEEMIGPNVADSRSVGVEALTVESLSSDKLDNITFSVREGEILGIYGLNDSGRSETLRSIAGLLKYSRAKMRVFGKEYKPRKPSDAINAGIAFLTEERKYDGIVPQMNSHQNVTLPVLKRSQVWGLLNLKTLKDRSASELDFLALRGDPSKPIVALSGGNQQKVLLGRALIQRPRVLLLDEPTKGVDIGVKNEIYRLLRSLASEGKMGIVFVSSEEEEILSLADRVITFAHGRVVGESVAAHRLSQAKLRELSWAE